MTAPPDRGRVRELELVDRDGGPLRRVVVVVVHPDDEPVAELTGAWQDVTFEVVRPPEAAAGDVDRLTEDIGDGRGVLLVAPWRHDGRPGHEAAGRTAAAVAARTGVRLLEYPRSTGRPPMEATVRHGQQLFVEQPPDDPTLEQVHRDAAEPWGADTRWFEERKRALLLAMLPDRELGRVLELGCSTGVTTEALASRSRELVAIDSSGSAVASASARLAAVPGVVVQQGSVPDDWPPGRFDVVVLSEVGYFLSPGALDRTVAAVRSSLTDGGVVLLCHWRHPIVGWVLDGSDVHAAFSAVPGWTRLAQYVDEDVELLLLGPSGRLPDATR